MSASLLNKIYLVSAVQICDRQNICVLECLQWDENNQVFVLHSGNKRCCRQIVASGMSHFYLWESSRNYRTQDTLKSAALCMVLCNKFLFNARQGTACMQIRNNCWDIIARFYIWNKLFFHTRKENNAMLGKKLKQTFLYWLDFIEKSCCL